MSMVLVGVGDSESGQLVVANAGHPDPLIISGQTPEYLTTKRGPPLGLGPNRYESVVVHLDPSATLLAYTDGLIERRGESLDVGLERLVSAAAVDAPTLQDWLNGVVSYLATDESKDDIAVLAFQWSGSDIAQGLSMLEPQPPRGAIHSPISA